MNFNGMVVLFCRQRSKHRSFLWALHPRQPQYQEGFQPADRTLHGIYRHSLCCHTVIGYVYRKKTPQSYDANVRKTSATRVGVEWDSTLSELSNMSKFLRPHQCTFLFVERASNWIIKVFFYIYFFILFLINKLRLFTMRKIERK